MACDDDIMQIVILHLHLDGAYLSDGHHAFDGLKAHATDANPGLFRTTGNDEVACFIADASTNHGRVGKTKQGDIGIHHGQTVVVDQLTRELCTVFPNALYKDFLIEQMNLNGIKATHFPNCIGK